MDEVWKDITGYEGRYAVSNLGRVKTIPHRVSNHTGTKLLKERILKPNVLAKGYLQLSLSDKDYKRRMFQVHRLVAMMFVPNPNNYPQVNHIDCNKQNNRVDNLEWCNNSMNQLHAYRMGLNKSHHNEWRNRTRAKNPVAKYTLDGKLVKKYKSTKEAFLEIENGVLRTFYEVVNGRKKTNNYKGFKYIKL